MKMHNTLAQNYHRAEPCRAEHVKVQGERRGSISLSSSQNSLPLAFDVYPVVLVTPDSIVSSHSKILYVPRIFKIIQSPIMGHVSSYL